MDFLRLYFSAFSLVLVSFERMYQTRKTVPLPVWSKGLTILPNTSKFNSSRCLDKWSNTNTEFHNRVWYKLFNNDLRDSARSESNKFMTFPWRFRYQVSQKTARPYYVVTESLLTNQACDTNDTKESCTRFNSWMLNSGLIWEGMYSMISRTGRYRSRVYRTATRRQKLPSSR